MKDERGSTLLWFLLAVVVIFFLFFGACDALFDDEDELNDLGWAASALMSRDDGDKRDDNRNKNGNDCNNASAACSDDDFSPSFDRSPVDDSFNPTICLPFSKCGGEE